MPRRVTLPQLLLIVWVFAPTFASAEEPPVRVAEQYLGQADPQDALHAAFRQKLMQRISCDFEKTPLIDAAKQLSEKSGIEFLVNVRSLREVGVSCETPVSLHLHDVRLRTLLRLLLREAGLSYQRDQNQVMIVSALDVQDKLHIQVYPCGDLLEPDTELLPKTDDPLLDVITQCVESHLWEELGGAGTIRLLDQVMVVSQTDDVHDQIAWLLKQLRHAKSLPNDKYDPTPLALNEESADQRKVELALQTDLNHVEFQGVPLQEAIRFLGEKCNLNIVLDQQSLKESGVTINASVRESWDSVTGTNLLRDLMGKLNLSYYLRDDVIVIAGIEEGEPEQVVKLYPVRDLKSRATLPSFPEAMEGLDFQTQLLLFDVSAQPPSEYQTLIEMLTSTVNPESWYGLGGPGEVNAYLASDVLVISQTEEIHQQIEAVLLKFRQAKQSAPLEEPKQELPVTWIYRVTVDGGESALVCLADALQQDVEPAIWNVQQRYVRPLGKTELLVRATPETQRQVMYWLQRIAVGPTGSATVERNQAPILPPTRATPANEGGFF